MIHRNEKICPCCDAPTMKNWSELTDEEKDVSSRLEKFRGLSAAQTKKCRICTRCWHYEDPLTPTNA